MAHLIEKHDRGAVEGTTWHGVASYQQLPGPVPTELAREISDYPMEILPSFIEANGSKILTGSRCIYRPDANTVLVASVGADYVVENNRTMFEHIESNILQLFPDIYIESTGTLRNGATYFINLKVKEFAVRGDNSKTVSRLCFNNPLGYSYRVGVHNVRVVCNNTLRAAEAEMAANGSLFTCRHSKGSLTKIPDVMGQMAEFRLGLDKHIEKLNYLATRQVNAEAVLKFLDTIYPVAADSSPIKMANVNLRRQGVLNIFESNQDMQGGTAYALLNAFTDAVDHREVSKESDNAYRHWTNLYGQAADQKEAALGYLLTAV